MRSRGAGEIAGRLGRLEVRLEGVGVHRAAETVRALLQHGEPVAAVGEEAVDRDAIARAEVERLCRRA